MFQSQLFQGDPILELVAADQARISRTENNVHDTVERVQKALLIRRSDCLPQFGADGQYGDETARAVKQLKIEEFPDLDPATIIDDVGPRTVQRLDEIAFAAETPIPPPPTTFIRRDAWAIDPVEGSWNPIMLAYAKAVAIMQSRPATDPTSWIFQAAIHGTYRAVASPTWNSCEHGNWFFLPWHRMYLFFFENIVREAVRSFGGPADFALPYWNYENPAPSNALPFAFRRPFLDDGVTPNPLLVPEPGRRLGFNQGTGRVGSNLTSAVAMRETRFVLPPPAAGFGGGAMNRSHSPARGSFGLLENNPHNGVHVLVGGDFPVGQCGAGLMIDPNCAALDPIFWLHHANIDRLWNVWLAQRGGTNPTDGAWTGQSFPFFEATGAQTSRTVSQVLNSVTDLNYAYDDIPSFVMPGGAQLFLEGAPMQLIGATDRPLEVGALPQSISLITPVDAVNVFQNLMAGTTELFLSIEDIQAESTPGAGYAVFLNVPDLNNPDDRVKHLVGMISLFGIELMNDPNQDHAGAPGMQHTFNVTDLVTELANAGVFDPSAISVTVEPVDLMETDDPSLQLDLSRMPTVKIGRISLFAG